MTSPACSQQAREHLLQLFNRYRRVHRPRAHHYECAVNAQVRIARLQCQAAQAAPPSRLYSQSKHSDSDYTDDSDWEDFDWDKYDWRDHAEEEPGPAFESALQALEWSTVCEHIASFAATMVGKEACRHLEIGSTLERTQVREAHAHGLPCLCTAHLDIQRTQTTPRSQERYRTDA